MKQVVIPIISLLCLFASCSKEEELTNSDRIKEVPVTIILPNGTITSKAGDISGKPTIPGEACTADRVQVLVYKHIQKRGTTGYNALDPAQYRYDATNVRQPVNCTPSGNNRIAQDVFKVDSEYDYWVIASAYRNIDAQLMTFSHDGTSLMSDKVSIIPQVANKEFNAPEFYYGFLHTKDDVGDHIISGDKIATGTDVSLTGTIYRSTGRVSITLTDVPTNVSKLNLLIEKYPKSCPLYATTNAYMPYHPIGFPLQDDLITTGITAATLGENDFTGTTAVITANTLRVEDSYLYIEAIQGEGASAVSTRYLLKCPNKDVYTIYVGIKEQIVYSYKITIPVNFHIKVKGSFNELTKGNLSIDGGSMNECFGGFLE